MRQIQICVQAIKMFIYNSPVIGLTCALALTTGCSSFAHRSYACREEVPLAVFGGNILQIGDCSLFKYFKIETGDYYRSHKFNIDHDVESFHQITSGTTETLGNFAHSYNCQDKYQRLFSERLSEQKEKIFGKDFSRSARQVSNAVQDMIDNDNELKQFCD